MLLSRILGKCVGCVCVCVCCLIESAFVGQWVAEKNSVGVGEKTEIGFKKEPRGYCSHVEVTSTSVLLLGVERCGGKEGSIKQAAIRQRLI